MEKHKQYISQGWEAMEGVTRQEVRSRQWMRMRMRKREMNQIDRGRACGIVVVNSLMLLPKKNKPWPYPVTGSLDSTFRYPKYPGKATNSLSAA